MVILESNDGFMADCISDHRLSQAVAAPRLTVVYWLLVGDDAKRPVKQLSREAVTKRSFAKPEG